MIVPGVWMKSCPDARRKKNCNRSNLMVVRIAIFFATPQMGDFSFKHYFVFQFSNFTHITAPNSTPLSCPSALRVKSASFSAAKPHHPALGAE